jgi:hypothetical protein
MISFKLIGVALVLSALLATPASACGAVSEPAAAASENPSFSIYSDNCGVSGSWYPMAAQPLNPNAMAEWRPVRPRRVHRAPTRHY